MQHIITHNIQIIQGPIHKYDSGDTNQDRMISTLFDLGDIT